MRPQAQDPFPDASVTPKSPAFVSLYFGWSPLEAHALLSVATPSSEASMEVSVRSSRVSWLLPQSSCLQITTTTCGWWLQPHPTTLKQLLQETWALCGWGMPRTPATQVDRRTAWAGPSQAGEDSLGSTWPERQVRDWPLWVLWGPLGAVAPCLAVSKQEGV